MAEPRMLAIEVAYAMPDAQWVRRLQVPVGTTVLAAAEAAWIAEGAPGVRIAADRLGVFGRKVAADRPVEQGERIEIYRPLALDPMQARRRRAGDRRA